MTTLELGLRANWKQFTLLVVVNAFVGAMVGLERSVLPLIASDAYHRGHWKSRAKRAFAKLTPSTQSFFGAPEKFLQAVADELPPVLVTKKFSFLGINRAGATTSEVLITDILGQEWLADFEMERQENGAWRVKGCVVQANPGQRA